MKTKHEKIIRREDGTRVKISVSIYADYRGANYSTKVKYCQFGKRKWIDAIEYDDFRYRKLKNTERTEFIKQARLKYASDSEFLEAKTELWNKLKPE